MMLYEKSDVIQECIDRLQDYSRSKYLGINLHDMGVAMGCIENLMKLKAEVDALAEQEVKEHATSVNEDKEIKEGTYLEKEVLRGNISDEDATMEVGVPGASYTTTPAEMEKNDYQISR